MGEPPLPSAKRLILLLVHGNSQSKHPKCLLKVFGGSRVNMSCSSSMTCTMAKYLLNKLFTEHDM